MRILQYDIEGDGLLDTISTIHCIVCKEMISGKVLRFYDQIEDFKPEDTDYPLAYARPVFKRPQPSSGITLSDMIMTCSETVPWYQY